MDYWRGVRGRSFGKREGREICLGVCWGYDFYLSVVCVGLREMVGLNIGFR